MYLIIIELLILILFIIYSIEKFNNISNTNIYIFYHIYCNNLTIDVIKDQISKIIWSGLYKKVNKIYCFLAGDNEYINNCSKYINNCGTKFSIEEIGINDKTYERFTLLKIKKYIKNDDKFLYLHSKGITKNNSKNVTDWRNLMEYFLISKHDICLNLLDNYDTIGVNKINNSHYSGNFWWTHGKYYLTLSDTIPDYYVAPEDYIVSGNPNAKSLYNSGLEGFGHYYNPYPINKYIDL